MDGVSALALILVVSFAIDRVVTGILFLLSFTSFVPDPSAITDTAQRDSAQRKKKLLYFLIAGILAAVVLLGHRSLRILTALGVGLAEAPGYLDALVTGIALVGGAERIAELQNMVGKPAQAEPEKEPPPIEITGRLIVEDAARRKSEGP